MSAFRTRAILLLLLSTAPTVALAVAESPYPGVWYRQIGTSSWDRAYGVSADGLGSVYIAGETTGSFGGDIAGLYDAFTAKYSAFGTPGITTQFGTAGNDFGTAIAADKLGNVFLAGYSGPNPAGYQGFIQKSDPSGAQQWFQYIGAGQTYSYGVTADGLGNAYVAGYTQNSLDGSQPTNAGGYDVFLAKYNSAGHNLFTRQFGTVGHDQAFGVSNDGLGRVYLTGSTLGALPGQMSAGGSDAIVSRFDDAGNLHWHAQLGTTGDEIARAVSADRLGNVYVVGNTSGALQPLVQNQGGDDAFISRFNTDGVLQWTKQFGTAGSDYAYGVATDALGNAFVVGYTSGALAGMNAGGFDWFLSKYAPDGELRFTTQFGTSGNDFAYAVATDEFGNVFVSGGTPDSLSPPSPMVFDPFVVRFTVPLLLGDLNRDGQLTAGDVQTMLVALSDLTTFKQPRGLTNADLLAIADFNHDDIVSNADLQLLLTALANVASQPMPVPEPASILMLSCGALALLIRTVARRDVGFAQSPHRG